MNAIASFTFTVPGCPVPWERVTPRGAGVARDAADLLAKKDAESGKAAP